MARRPRDRRIGGIGRLKNLQGFQRVSYVMSLTNNPVRIRDTDLYSKTWDTVSCSNRAGSPLLGVAST